ncbi:cytochrome b-c1 complex subunit 1, mitochondrial [Bombyx mori]|uniref:Mitochondrial processing peptidase beta subunit n=1 Tax=Bombyx mori TaxID=7091 RepID=A0A8R2M069_BOMMO|nr:cytochrome b-c1 complex subunit 1, mitochondrial-like [Bombyx mori]
MFRKTFKSFFPKWIRLNRKRSAGVCHPVDPNDPGTKISLLPNGVRIATEQTQSPLACVSLFIEAGPRFETPENNGASHFLEHMAFCGFKSMNQCEIEHNLLQMGAKINAETTKEIQRFVAICPSENAHEMVAFLCRIITDLDLNDSSIETEKHNMCYELVDSDNDPKAVMFEYLHQTAFQGTPLAQSVIGPSKNIQNFDSQLLSSFMTDHYQPYKVCFATSGNVDHKEVVRIAETMCGKMVGDPTKQFGRGPCRFTGSQIMYRDDSMPCAHVAIGFEVPGYGHEDYLKLLVMGCMMGAWDKSQGGGNSNVPVLACAAASGLCESYEPFYFPYGDIGLWGVYYVGQPLVLEDMLNNIQDYWMKMCVSVHYTDLERAKNLAKLKVAKMFDGTVNSSYDIGMQLMYFCGRKPLISQYELLSNIKPDSIREAADKYLYDRCPAVACVGPTEGMPDYTKIRAGQYWLRY